jgi:phosphate transport system permease protein
MVDVSKSFTINSAAEDTKAIIRRHKLFDSLFAVLGVVALSIALITLSALVIKLGIDGIGRISPEFFTAFPSRFAEKAGILSAWVGTLLVMLVTAFTATTIGVAAGIYLEEYAPKNWFAELIEINIANLAGVPSIVYGLLALGVFVYQLKLGQSVLTAGLTLALLVLPIVIVSTREAMRSVPRSIHEASYALGATKWQTMQDHILPYSLGGILTGIIIALSRAIGETAPLITIGAMTFIAFLPEPPLSTTFPFISFQWLMSPFTVLPIQMFNWTSRPQEAFQVNAAAAGLVLLAMTLSINAVAIYLRASFRKRIKW